MRDNDGGKAASNYLNAFVALPFEFKLDMQHLKSRTGAQVLPVLAALTLIGLTIMVPSPSLASAASVNEVCACEAEPVAVR